MISKIEEVLEEFNVTLNIEDSYCGGRSPPEARFLQPSIRLRYNYYGGAPRMWLVIRLRAD